MNRNLFHASVIAAVIGLPSTVVVAGPVTGEFVIDGRVLPTAHVVAYRVRDFSDARRYSTHVMLTARPVDREAIANADDPRTTAINDEAVANDDFITFLVDPDGKVSMNASVGGVQYLDSSGLIMGERGSLVAECQDNTAQRIACAIRTAEPVKSLDGPTWSMDLRFDTGIVSSPTASPLPADGGAAGRAFDALMTALQEASLEAILAGLVPEQAGYYSADYLPEADRLDSVRNLFEYSLPKQAKVTGGTQLNAETAMLEVEGMADGDTRMLYAVRMEQHAGRWGYASSRVLGLLK